MSDDIADLTRLAAHVKSLIAARKKQAVMSGKDYSQMTQRAIGNHSANMSWLGMEIEKSMHEAHAAAVDCGIAEARPVEQYGDIDFRPSAFHHYRHTPTRPRCRQ